MDSADHESTAKRKRSRWQVSLFTLLLLAAAIASWAGYFRLRYETEQFSRELPALLLLSRELEVRDPDQFAVVRHHQQWHDDFRWRVYLPPGQTYQACLATYDVTMSGSETKPTETQAIEPGEHEIELTYATKDNEWWIEVSVDGEVVLAKQEPLSWNDGDGSTGGAYHDATVQSATTSPLELFRRKFRIATRANAPDNPENGIRLWIESAGHQP